MSGRNSPRPIRIVAPIIRGLLSALRDHFTQSPQASPPTVAPWRLR